VKKWSKVNVSEYRGIEIKRRFLEVMNTMVDKFKGAKFGYMASTSSGLT